MKKQRFNFPILFLIFFLTIGACTLRSTAVDPLHDNYTEQLTAAAPAPEVMFTIPPIKPSSTPEKIQPAEQVYKTTPTSLDPGQLPVSSCDHISIEDDTTIPDGTNLEPGQVFIKAWKVKNNGDCIWSSDYRLVLYQGEALGAPPLVQPFFTQPDNTYELIIGTWPIQRFNIRPGEIVDLAMLLQSPDKKGSYLGVWTLINAHGERLDPVFWVSINVATDSSEINPSGWSGKWVLGDPYRAGRDISIYLFPFEGEYYGSFYDAEGKMKLITAWKSSDGNTLKGEYGAPDQPAGNTFIWSMLPGDKGQFQGVKSPGQFNQSPWCGSRPGESFPQPCEYTPNPD